MPEDIRREAQPDDIFTEALVTERDKLDSRRFWGRYATPLFKRLLDAIRSDNAGTD